MVKNNNWRKTAEARRPASTAAADSTLATVTTDTKVKQLLCTISNFLLFSAIPARSLEMSPSATFLFLPVQQHSFLFYHSLVYFAQFSGLIFAISQ